MHGEGLFFQAFVYLLAAIIAVPVAKRLGLGSVLGYLIAGVVIGPFGLHLVGEEGKDVMHFAEFGVVMMLFLVGLELRPSLLWRLRAPILGMGGLQVAATTAVMTGVGLALKIDWRVALAIAMILALSSTAIVLQTMNEKGLMKSHSGQSAFAVLLFQDIAVIPMLALLPLLATFKVEHHGEGPHGPGWIESLPGWTYTLVVLGVVAGIVIGGLFLSRPVFRMIAKTRLRELFTAAALLLVIGIALVMTEIGLSPALGTFLAGVVLANSEYRHELETDIEPFKGLLLGLFFIAVGASIDFGLIGSNPGMISGLVVTLISLKLAMLLIVGRIFKLGTDQNLIFGFSLAQGGEFAFVLFSFATQNGVIPSTVANPLIAVTALSMALTPLLSLVNEKLLLRRLGTKEEDERQPDDIHEENRVIIAGYGSFGSIVGRLLRANGIGCTVLDTDSDHVDVLRKLGIKVFYGDATRHDLLHAAGAEKAKVLVVAIDDEEKAVEMVSTVRKHFPHLTILARAGTRTHAYDLLDTGLDHVYRESLDSSLRLGVDALKLVGFRSYQALRAARTFRLHDEQYLRELAVIRHDEKAYISHARQRIHDLEQILVAEVEDTNEKSDLGWDCESTTRKPEPPDIK
ncbi:MAG: potassium transporter [Proteobacteria bacterium]|jgi:monovalent cation:H+ antiporter-2, CPA2 family|nr:potassium transporter [Pseudomonadota bacterium]